MGDALSMELSVTDLALEVNIDKHDKVSWHHQLWERNHQIED